MNAVATAPPATDRGFRTVFGRELVAELPNFVHRPYFVVTMADLWPLARAQLRSPSRRRPRGRRASSWPIWTRWSTGCRSSPAIIGLGGGRALDVAKFFAWRRGRPLFQVPTAMTTNAAFNHRCALRHEGREVGIGWAVPEAVYVDVDLIRTAPPLLNRSGVADVLCHHTATVDWKLAHDAGREDRRWPYDERLVAEARDQLEAVVGGLDEIHDVSDAGIRLLDRRPSLGGRVVPRGRLERLPSRRRRPRIPGCPGVPDWPSLHPWAGDRARNLPGVRPPGERAGARAAAGSIAPGSTSGPRRWGSTGRRPRRRCGGSPGMSATRTCRTRSPTSGP